MHFRKNYHVIGTDNDLKNETSRRYNKLKDDKSKIFLKQS